MRPAQGGVDDDVVFVPVVLLLGPEEEGGARRRAPGTDLRRKYDSCAGVNVPVEGFRALTAASTRSSFSFTPTAGMS